MVMSNEFYIRSFKPFCDRFFALVALVLLIPLMILISMVLLVHFKSSPIYFHRRPGKDGMVFSLWKFKTMKIEGDENSITDLGNFLRSFSVDELPQLINVLKGDMTFIGPRPLFWEYLPFYNKREKKRHEVMPGMTGWAQVNGRNSIDWEQRLQLDIYYVDHISFKLDLPIMLLTFVQLLKKDKTGYGDKKIVKFSEYASKR